MKRIRIPALLLLVIGLSGCAQVVHDTGGGLTGFSIVVSPTDTSLRGTSQQQFTATTSDGSTPAFVWAVNGVTGGSASTGTISATGLYLAPEFPPASNAITISATETSDSTKSGSTSITLQNPVPQLTTATPMTFGVGSVSLTINGLHFAPGAVVYLGGTALTTTRVSSTQVTATGSVTSGQIGSVSILVTNPDPGSIPSNSLIAQITQSGTLVAVNPPTASVRSGITQLFTASVTGNSNTGVTWSVNGIAGGNFSLGFITANGNYTAPPVVPNPNSIQVTATSVADTTASGNSAVTLQNPLAVLTQLSPTSVSVGTFTLTVTGSSFLSGATINFGGQNITTHYVSSTQLTATINATAAQAGSVPITVINPNPGSAPSNALNLLVTQPNSNISVSVSPSTANLQVAGGSQSFTATVNGTTDTTVTWEVNGIQSGDAQYGYISDSGVYVAPDNIPSGNAIIVSAVPEADTTKSGTASVTLTNPQPVLDTVSPSTIGPGAFQISLNGTGFVNTSTVTFGGQQLQVLYATPTLITAIGTGATPGTVPVKVSNPNPGAGNSATVNVTVTANGSPMTPAAAARFLEQSSFGPNTESMNQAQELGFDLYLQNEFASPSTLYRTYNPAINPSVYNMQSSFFLNSAMGGDQLRRRVSLALNEWWVVAGDKVSDPVGYTNYLTTLDQDAFSNFYNLMKDITLTPAMGNYLDMVNNDKPAPGQHANENYAREIMQLFCLGLSQLNPDGTQVLDTTGNPVPSYTQDDVMALGLAFTGWTYPVKPGAGQQKHNPEYYGGPMVAVDSNHDMEAKTLLGQSIPSGQTSENDLDSALTIIFNHPNVGPFVAQQLIVHLVTSNPSPQYVQRVAQAFSTGTFVSPYGQSFGAGQRGDMQATIAAVLLDQEARRGDDSNTAVATDGKLREPIVMEAAMLRAFHAQSDGGGLPYEGDAMEQNVYFPATVFNFFPPVNAIPGTSLNGPEFAIFDTNSSLSRVNFIDDMVYGAVGSSTKFDFSPVSNAGTPDQMLDWLNTLFLHGSMPDSMRQDIITAVNAVDSSDAKGQAKAAIYLVTSSSMYQVQH
ncbi:MAG TPA: DUF1800 family protein [Candidatus Eisenbacteria bacterium]|nr:DUF1800 family protein [Candidatus Eisenbacteria bacterium]